MSGEVPSLVAISPGDHGTGRDLAEWLSVLGRAGLPAVLIREPHVDRITLRAVVDAACKDVPVVWIHARCADTFGLPTHISARGTPPRNGQWGRSCHTAQEVDEALAAGAAWTVLSPVWTPHSKPDDARLPLGPERFLNIARGRPVLALGGVTVARYQMLRRGGAHGAAVLGSVLGAPSLGEATARLNQLHPRW